MFKRLQGCQEFSGVTLGLNAVHHQLARIVDFRGKIIRTPSIRVELRDQPAMGLPDGVGIRIGINAENRRRFLVGHRDRRWLMIAPRIAVSVRLMARST